MFSFPTAKLLLQITAKSITQAGSPVISNQPSGRPQIPEKAGESQGICIISVPDQEQAEDDVSESEELQLNPLRNTITEIEIWTVILSFKKSFELFLQYLGYKLNVFVRDHDVGSLLITVECSSLQILQGLWEDYCSGHLNAIAQEILVTGAVLEKLGLNEVRLKTFISEEEYEKGKEIFKEISGKWHLLSIIVFLNGALCCALCDFQTTSFPLFTIVKAITKLNLGHKDKFEIKICNLAVVVHFLRTSQDLSISRFSFAQNSKEKCTKNYNASTQQLFCS